jgi:hypothetical protein
MTFRLIAVTAAFALSAACGSSGNPAPGNPAPTTPPGTGLTLLVNQAPEAPGATCPYGGTIISAGLDADRDGILDPDEVAKTEPVCDPAPGTPPAVLTRTAAESAGTNCAAGGTRIDAGRDVNGDGLLADSEVERTAYACAEPVPAAPPVLTRVDVEPMGANCLGGGSTVRFGPDTDRNGALDDAEVTGVRYICETRALPGFTIRTKADAELVSAASVVDGYLNVQITEAVDLDLSPTAVTGGIYVSSPALTGLGVYCWTIGDYVRVEGNPHLQRFWMGSPAALGGDVIVQDNPELTSVVLPSMKGIYGIEPYRYPADLVIARNAKIEALALFYPVEVSGNLVIEGNPVLRDLFFDGLRRVGGHFVLADNDAMVELPNLKAMPLDTVGGALDVRDNAKLARLTFDALQTTGGVRIARNASLSSTRFPKLVAVLGSVSIQDNPVLGFSFYPADPLQLVTGWFSVERNTMLSSLGEFDNVFEIGGTLTISNNPKLRDLAFERLVRAGSVTIADNASLEGIGPSLSSGDPILYPPSLLRLETMEQLDVARNGVLRQLILPSIQGTSSSLIVHDNPLLPTCQAEAIPATYKYISGNDDTATCP